jgi:hypothetical protein
MAALETVAEEQETDDALIVDLRLQGVKKTTSTTAYMEAVVAAIEPIPFCTIQEGSPYAQVLHLMARYCALERLKTRVHFPIYNKYMGAIAGDEDPLFVKTRRTSFKWKNVSPLANQTDTSKIGTFFALEASYIS